MIDNFTRIFNQVSHQVKDKVNQTGRAEFYYILDTSVICWCQKLNFSNDIINGINRGYKISEIEGLTEYLWDDCKIQKRQTLLGTQEYRGRLFTLIKVVFNRINIASDYDINIIISLGFLIAAIGYWIYILNQPKEQEQISLQTEYTPPQQPSHRVSQPVSTVSTPLAPIQQIVKKSLILVVSAAQESIVDSIKAKHRIDYDDCEKLYEATQYLCQDNESNLLPRLAKTNQFKAIEKSEYDIYIVTIELNQADEGFNKDVNQLDRYDAFRNLANLAVNVQVSPRLQMEAYGIFDVYNR